jgi:hypothetical protein
MNYLYIKIIKPLYDLFKNTHTNYNSLNDINKTEHNFKYDFANHDPTDPIESAISYVQTNCFISIEIYIKGLQSFYKQVPKNITIKNEYDLDGFNKTPDIITVSVNQLSSNLPDSNYILRGHSFLFHLDKKTNLYWLIQSYQNIYRIQKSSKKYTLDEVKNISKNLITERESSKKIADILCDISSVYDNNIVSSLGTINIVICFYYFQ